MIGSLGTHNLHDEQGVPTFFADVLLFTEAVPRTIRARARRAAANARGRLAGRRVLVCKEQRDLVIVVRRRQVRVTGRSYIRVHEGRAGVTPHRGIFVVYGIERDTGRKVAIVCEHRINAAFYPWKRGEALFRETLWNRHKAATTNLIERLEDSGFDVFVGGDPNTPGHVLAYYKAWREIGRGVDRVASTRRLRGAQYLTRKGSDHPRLRTEVRPPA